MGESEGVSLGPKTQFDGINVPYLLTLRRRIGDKWACGYSCDRAFCLLGDRRDHRVRSNIGGRVPGSVRGQLQYEPTGFILDSDPGNRLAFSFSEVME